MIEMQSVIKNGCGRRLESDVWSHFKFDPVSQRSKCLVVSDEKPCDKYIAGKNTTNLKNHLQSQHRQIFDSCQKQDASLKRKASLPTVPAPLPTSGSSVNSSTHTIVSMLKRAPVWAPSSAEVAARERALADYIIASGTTSRIVDEPSFRVPCQTLDPKFSVPG